MVRLSREDKEGGWRSGEWGICEGDVDIYSFMDPGQPVPKTTRTQDNSYTLSQTRTQSKSDS